LIIFKIFVIIFIEIEKRKMNFYKIKIKNLRTKKYKIIKLNANKLSEAIDLALNTPKRNSFDLVVSAIERRGKEN
jgi:hypothetical protein